MVEQLIYQMDANGIEKATLVAAQIENNKTNNDYIAEAVKKYPNRLHQLADMDSAWSSTYHKPGAAKRLDAAIRKYNMEGFTHYLAYEDDGAWLYKQDGIDFLSVAADANLIASISCHPHHQPAIRKIAERFPDMPFVCHHMSGVKANEPPPFNKLKEVLLSGSLPNIYLKISGFAYVSQEDGEYPYADTQWIVKSCYEHYGRRMMWGSDFPVVNKYMTYQQSLEVFRKHCDFLEEEDKKAILGGTLHNLLQRFK